MQTFNKAGIVFAVWLLLLGIAFLFIQIVHYRLFGGAFASAPADFRAVYLSADRAAYASAGYILLGFLGLAGFAGGAMYFVPGRERVHGSSRWATALDMKRMGLGNKGFLLGEYRGNFLYTDDATPIIIVASPGAGKTVSYSIPNLLIHPGSVIVTDPKRELWTMTAGYRQAHRNEVFLFDPLSDDTCCINPLDFVENDQNRITQFQRIAALLVPEGGSDPFWALRARDLFVGLLCMVFDLDSTSRTIGEINRFISSDAPLAEVFEELKAIPELSDEARKVFNRYCEMPDKTRGGVLAQLHSALSLWDNPKIDRATSSNEVDLPAFKKRCISLYLGYNVKDVHFLAPILSLVIDAAINIHMERLPGEDEPHQILFLLEEFATLHNVAHVDKIISSARGYNLRIVPVIQSVSQLSGVLRSREAANAFIECCAHQVFFAQNDASAQQYVSSRLGTKTVRVKTRSLNSQGIGRSYGRSRSYSETSRPLLFPAEVGTLDQSKVIVLARNHYPLLLKHTPWFKHRELKERILPAPSGNANIHDTGLDLSIKEG